MTLEDRAVPSLNSNKPKEEVVDISIAENGIIHGKIRMGACNHPPRGV